MNRRFVAKFSTGGLLLGLTGCRHDDDFDPPTPPDMAPLVAAYDAPTGELTPATAVQLAEGLVAKAKDIQAAAVLVGSLTEAMTGFSKAQAKAEGATPAESDAPPDAGADGVTEDGTATLSQGLSGSIDLWMRALWTCIGWEGAEAPVDDKWGRIVLNAVGSHKALGDVIWGRFEDCRLLQSDGLQQAIDGAVDVRFPTGGSGGGTDLLVRFAGTWIGPDGKPADLHIDFRWLDDALSTLQDTDGGSFVVEVPFAQLATLLQGGGLAVRDAGGAWSCHFGVNLKGGSCERNDAKVTW